MLKKLFLTAAVLALAASLGAQEQTEPKRKSGKEMSLRLVHQVRPVYPPEAKAAGIEGLVRMDAYIDEEGRVTKLNTLEGPAELRNSAEAAVIQWRYEPLGMKVIATVDVNYTLAKDKPAPEKK